MSSYSSYTIGEAEAHLNGMLEAADMCDRHLRHDVADTIRMAVTIRRVSRMPLVASVRPVQADDWVERYVDAVRRLEDGRAAFKARLAISSFGTQDEFLCATDERLLEAPQCGPAILALLKVVRDEV